MTTAQINRAVSRATGEEIGLIAKRGFNLVDDDEPLAEDDWEALALDWDRVDAERRGDQLPIAA